MIWFNTLIAQLLILVPKPLVKIFAAPYIAGESLDQALKKTKNLNELGINVTLDFLGEDPKTKIECQKAVDVYKNAIQEICKRDLKSGISLKPSHMGIKIDKQFCFNNLSSLITYARDNSIFVRLDMEEFVLKEDTMDLYLRLRNDFENVGIVMQAYLRSAIKDISRIIKTHANTRLCKGAYYWEDKKITYKDMDIINSSYVYLMEKLLSNNCFTAIATHDEKLVFEALKLIDKLEVSKENYEFQMLYGVREDLREIIHGQGHPIRVYVPFGKEWFAYAVRRLKENPKMVSYIIANWLKRII